MMTQDEMNELMAQRFALEAAGEIDWQARAESAEARLDELRENILLGLGMTAEEVTAIDDDLIEPTISYLLSGHAELEARVAELEAELAAAQPAIEAWAQHQADNERRAQLQEDMIAEGLIKRPFWQ